MTLFPVVSIEPVDLATANRLMVAWTHPLGPCRRPFGACAHVMIVRGDPVACSISASTVSATVAGFGRHDVVELARIARSPSHPWVLRPMLRVWREVLAHEWQHWSVRAAVSYALPGTPGDLYRFDGWRRVGPVRRSGGGGSWSARPAVNTVGDGVKSLWIYEYPTSTPEVSPL